MDVIVMGAAGRMGSLLARMVEESEDMRLVAVVDRSERLSLLASSPTGRHVRASSDLASLLPDFPGALLLDFTAPAATMATARLAAQRGNPLVIGTTGLSAEQKAELEQLAATSPMLFSPSMSVGINVLLEILPQLVAMLGADYDADVLEIHHKHKKDAPSGTALRLAETLARAKGWTLEETGRCCREGIIGERPQREIGVQALRGGDVVGVHTVYLMGPGERVEITHQAHSRENFANGALRAARWLAGRQPGKLYSMQDVLHASI